MSEYSEKLKDPRWQKMRLKVLERDKFSCQLCGNEEKTLMIHHKKYKNGKQPWEYPLNSLITLCEDCHKMHHGKNEEEQYNYPFFIMCKNKYGNGTLCIHAYSIIRFLKDGKIDFGYACDGINKCKNMVNVGLIYSEN